MHDGAAAFAYSNGDVVVESAPALSTLLHELSHSLDWHAYSAAHQTGRTNMPRIAIHPPDTDEPSGWKTLPRLAWSVSMTKLFLAALAASTATGTRSSISMPRTRVIWVIRSLPGGTCNKRFPNTAPVHESGSKRSEDVDEKPDTEFKSDNITFIVSSKEIEGQIAYTWL